VEAPDDDGGSVSNVALGNFLGGKGISNGNGTVEVVGVSCAKAGDRSAGLGPGSCELRVGVNDAADRGELAVQMGVRVQVTRGA
jgi:hypothetical protein